MTDKRQMRLQNIRVVLTMAAFAVVVIAYVVHRFRP